MNELRIGSRGSPLALWQANAVAERVAATGGPPCRIVTIRTSGDRLQSAPLSEVGGKRLFVKEIEDALLAGDVDVAVHSSKDMTAILPDGLTIAAVLPREDPRDAIVLPAGSSNHDRSAAADDLSTALGASPVVGTGSVRRIAQVTRLVPQARFAPLRGNLETRLRKLDGREYDALVLAAAGLRRLGYESRISLALPVAACVPAPGQGIVAIEVREDDDETRRIVARIDDPLAGAALVAERALVSDLGGGCQTPIGALASPADGDALELVGVVISLDGRRIVRREGREPRDKAAALGSSVAAELLAAGAGDILEDVRRQQTRRDAGNHGIG
jgi:hydroxymethylbilane synthase